MEDFSRLAQYAHTIMGLPEKSKYEKKELLIPDLLIDKHRDIEIFYSTHNEYINREAKILIVGITPGWTQMEHSIRIARECLLNNQSYSEISKIAKYKCRFYGSMRANLIDMLDRLNLHEFLNIVSCKELFSGAKNLLHSTSMLRYPVFVQGANYNGHSPKALKESILNKYILESFPHEASSLNSPLIIPLGKAVEEVLNMLTKNKIILKEQCLLGFPHPSGANGHRNRQFEKHKDSMIIKIKNYFFFN